MKKYLLILILLASVSIGKLSAQQLNYQGIARNANGVAMAFQEISLRLTIRDGSSTGISVYSETRLVRTNQFGLFTIVIGSPGASNISGSFVTINWISGNKYLQVEIDPAGGSAFQLAGVSQLQSVPYAYFAAAAYPVGLAGGDLRGSTYPDPIIAPKVVTNGKLADTSVSTIKIIDRNVTNIKIANPYIYFNDLPVQLGQGQYFIIDSLGSNFNILSYDSIHKFNIPSASATKRGLLKSNDWTYFNNKLNLSDTAAMLLGYTRLNRFLDTATAIGLRIQNKLNITDAANTYVPLTRTINGFDLTANRTLTTSNILEGSNLYYTDVRSRTAISSGSGISYNNVTGLITNSLPMVYPPAGIALSTGSSWSTSITDNSSNWNTAYNKRLLTASLSSSLLTLTLGDATLITANVPTWNQNTTGTAVNVTGIILGANGGTGVSNTGKTITLGGNLVTSGAFQTTLTSTGATTLTLPVTGTLATLAGAETLINKTIAAGTTNTITGLTNANLSGTAGITDANLATISTALKVANSATTATNVNTPSAIVQRDASGNFTAGTITATLSGNATNVTGIILGANGGTGVANTGKTITLGGNLVTSGAFQTTLTSTGATTLTLPVTGTLATLAGAETLTNKTIAAGTTNTITGLTNANLSGTAGITDANLATISTALKVANSATTATNVNTPSAIVQRDASGNFTAGTITANLTGIASNASNLAGGVLGSLPYQSSVGATSLLSGNTTTAKQFLTSTGIAGNATAPAWGTITTNDLPFTASGDLLYGTGLNLGAVLAKGTNGRILTMVSDLPAWVTPASNNQWSILGNTGLDAANNFLGTTDNVPLRFRVNNIWAGEINPITTNTSFGYESGLNNVSTTNTFNNTSFGHFAMKNTENGGIDNTAVGQGALQINTTGDNNTAIGQGALKNSAGTNNTAVGQATLNLTTRDNNTAIGRAALESSNGGDDNTAVGYLAGRNFGNTFVTGDQATNITRSVMIGSNTRTQSNISNNEIVIGYDAVGNGSSTVQLGNTSVTLVNTSGRVAAAKFIGNSTTPIVTFSDATILNSGTPTITGNDVTGYISFTTGAAPAGTGDFITIQFSSFYTVNAPVVIIQPVVNTGTKGLATSIYCLPSATSLSTFTIATGSALTANTAYQIAYHVLGR